MGYLNPLLRLPAGRALLELPAADRMRLARVMRELREQANSEAETAWRRRKGWGAAYWRAVSTYARHVAHALTRKPDPAAMASAMSTGGMHPAGERGRRLDGEHAQLVVQIAAVARELDEVYRHFDVTHTEGNERNASLKRRMGALLCSLREPASRAAQLE